MRIYKDRLYHVVGKTWHSDSPGTEGYVAFDCVTTGEGLRTYFSIDDVRGEWTPDERMYRVEDGHLPDHQPRIEAAELSAWLGQSMYRTAHVV